MVPTSVPTLSPSLSLQTEVKFVGAVTLASVTESDFDGDYVAALEDSIAESISDDPSSTEVNVTGFSTGNTEGRRRLRADLLSVEFTVTMIAEKVGITVVFVDDVFDEVLSKIDTSASSGALASAMNIKLVESKDSDVKTVVVDNVIGDKSLMVLTQVRSPVPSSAPTYAPTQAPKESSGGDTLLIIIIVAVAVLVLGFVVYWKFCKRSQNRLAKVHAMYQLA